MKNSALVLLFLICSCSEKVQHSALHIDKQIVQNQCEVSIQKWIIRHALFPDTYKPLKFDSIRFYYSLQDAKEVFPLRKYYLTHTFELQDTANKVFPATFVFELEPDYFVDHVRYKETNVLNLKTRFYPPVFDDWKSQFGRAFTSGDTLDWQAKGRVELYNLSEQFKENRYNKSKPENIQMTDSLVREMNRIYLAN